jgi:hypothetical protein
MAAAGSATSFARGVLDGVRISCFRMLKYADSNERVISQFVKI